MFGYIQQIITTNPEYGYDTISDKNNLVIKLLQTEKHDLFNELMQFLSLRSAVFDAHKNFAGDAVRVSYGGDQQNSYFYFYLLQENDWNFIESYPEYPAFAQARSSLFEKLGWINLGCRKILSPIDSDKLNENSLLMFDDMTYVNSLWNSAVPV